MWLPASLAVNLRQNIGAIFMASVGCPKTPKLIFWSDKKSQLGWIRFSASYARLNLKNKGKRRSYRNVCTGSLHMNTCIIKCWIQLMTLNLWHLFCINVLPLCLNKMGSINYALSFYCALCKKWAVKYLSDDSNLKNSRKRRDSNLVHLG